MKLFKLLITTAAFSGMLLPTYGSDKIPTTSEDVSSSQTQLQSKTEALQSLLVETIEKTTSLADSIEQLCSILTNVKEYLLTKSSMPIDWLPSKDITIENFDEQFQVRKHMLEDLRLEKTGELETKKEILQGIDDTDEKQISLKTEIGTLEGEIAFVSMCLNLLPPLYESEKPLTEKNIKPYIGFLKQIDNFFIEEQ